ncbi:hypothetical protein KDRO_E00180 [Kluyveromyces lactis]|nr:hypothetical protein KDRO_E00180 [Kluyveromyces lactis]
MQNKMYWADYQYQTCYRNVPGACGSSNFCCGAYSPYIRVNAPISDNHADNRNVGCSIGSAAEMLIASLRVYQVWSLYC